MRQTKADLLHRITVLEDASKHIAEERDSARLAAEFHKRAYEGRTSAEEEAGVKVYVARNTLASPTCLYGLASEEGMALSLYMDADRKQIIGAVIYDAEGDILAGAGLVPFGFADAD